MQRSLETAVELEEAVMVALDLDETLAEVRVEMALLAGGEGL
jgi:hypothetical protein